MGRRGGRTFILLCLSCLLVPSCSETDTIEQGKHLEIGEQLVSSTGVFKLGFFVHQYGGDTGRSKLFLGIWYNDINWSQSTDEFPIILDPVWIANRNAPISNRSGILSVDHQGNLKIFSGEREFIALYSTGAASVKVSAVLQDDGNFVLHQLNSDGSVSGVLWQSFEHPTDTILPGMKLGINLKTGSNWTLRSGRSRVSPALGSFTLGIDPNGTKELVLWWGEDVYWRSGRWQQSTSDFQHVSQQDYGYRFSFFQNENETYFTYTAKSVTIFPRIKVNCDGGIAISKGALSTSKLSCYQTYKAFTPNAGCIKPKLPECRRTIQDNFSSYNYLSFKYGSMSSRGFRFSDNDNLTLEDCKVKCLLNCSCFAFANTNEDNTGCEIWTSKAYFSRTKNARSILMLESNQSKWWLWLRIAVGGMIILLAFFSACYILWKSTSKGDENMNQRLLRKELEGIDEPSISLGKPKGRKKDRNKLHVFSFESIASATNHFSTANKLGEGGFGPVYKGILFDGQEVAIKRLSRSSGQGLSEFKNEVLLIAKLQHNNLVRLLGFCFQAEEKILVYEYMANKSLDSFLFDPVKKKLLNWKRRLIIIEEIAQGLLYLHKYSRLRVIHRDLKASNILLDDEMNPKISDFGMARIFGPDESEANTSRVVGTYGYMPPEYAYQGIVSIKTDVFSFGVLLLEIVSGRKNTSRYHPEHHLTLVVYAWQLWNEGRGLELMDPTMDEFCPRDQILRCVNIGLLCVQDCAMDRPTMSDVVSMLSNETMSLPKPKHPAFFITTAVQEEACVLEIKPENCSINNVSITVMEAR